MPSVGLAGTNGSKKWYGDDLTINPNSGQTFIEIYFEQAEDYNNTNGLLVPNGDVQFMNYSETLKDKVKGMVYMLTTVTSTFSKGKFEQSLAGFIPEFALEGNANATTTPPSAANPREEISTPGTSASTQLTSDTNRPENGTSSATTIKPNVTPPVVSKPTTPTSDPVPATPPVPPEPPAYVAPNPSPTSRTTFAGAMIKAYMMGFTTVSVPVFLPSGKELSNVRGWGATQWDAQIAIADPRDIEALSSLKASYDTVIQPLITDVETKVAANAAAKAEYDKMLANWGTTAGTGTSTPIGNRADDDSGK
jgi:hypothetical protein